MYEPFTVIDDVTLQSFRGLQRYAKIDNEVFLMLCMYLFEVLLSIEIGLIGVSLFVWIG